MLPCCLQSYSQPNGKTFKNSKRKPAGVFSYVSIQYPIKSKHICTVRNVRIATVIIIVVSLVCGLPKVSKTFFVCQSDDAKVKKLKSTFKMF